MSYMINYKNEKTPYEDWLNKSRNENAIFLYHEHYCSDCMHGMFVMDPSGTSGLYYFSVGGNDIDTDLYANILIDATAKKLHIYDCVFSYINDYNMYDTNIKNGTLEELKNYKEDEIGFYKMFLEDFFGKNWEISYDYTPKMHKQRIRTYRKKINRLERATHKSIPEDIKQTILKQCIVWTENQFSKITPETQTHLKNLFELHGGGIPADERGWGIYYPWGKTIAVYGF